MTNATFEAETIMVGRHEFRFIPPDRIRIAFCGDFDLPHAEPYLDFVYGCSEKCGGLLYAAYDLSDIGQITPSLRQRLVQVDRPYPCAAVAVFGATISTRAVVTMVLAAARILKPNHVAFPHKFVDSFDEANAWFDELKGKR